MSALEPHESSASALGASFSLGDAFPQKCVKVSLIRQLCGVPTASPQPEACGVPVAQIFQDSFPETEGESHASLTQPFTFHRGAGRGSPRIRNETDHTSPPPSGPPHHRTTTAASRWSPAAPTPWATNVPRRSGPLVPTGDILPLTVRGIEGEKLERKIWKPPEYLLLGRYIGGVLLMKISRTGPQSGDRRE